MTDRYETSHRRADECPHAGVGKACRPCRERFERRDMITPDDLVDVRARAEDWGYSLRLLDALDTAEAKVERQRDRLRSREEQVRRLRAEVTRLHALVADLRATAPPVWDEEVLTEAVETALHDDACPEDPDESEPCSDYSREAEIVLAVVRDHLPVQPDREVLIEAMSAALHVTTDRIPGLNPGPVLSADCTSVHVATDAVLPLLPGRTEAEVKDEALREAAEWLLRVGYVTDITFDIAAPAALWDAFVDAAHRDADGKVHGNTLTRDEVDDWLSVESGRRAAEGGVDRG